MAQSEETRITIDFVQIVDRNHAEAIHYYQRNWKVLRDEAIKAGYIDSYQLLETPFTPEAPFDLMLITRYNSEKQYAAREEDFERLIAQHGQLNLLNDKEPNEFRKLLFYKEPVKLLDGSSASDP